jgi:hypothetical protein
MRVALTGGAYAARSLIADAQRCVNLYVEPNPQDANAPATHYPTPGLTLLSAPPSAQEGRGVYTSTTGRLFVALGQVLYYVDASWNWISLGALTTDTGPVSMIDNGSSLFMVDGSTSGYIVNLPSMTMSVCVDEAFYGADRVDIVDGYFVFNKPNSPQFYISLYNDVKFDPLDIASKNTYPDNLMTHAVMHREIWLFGELTTEVWFNSGAPDFTFQRMPGVFIEHGCAAKHSVAKIDLALFWLGRDLQGQGIVFAGRNYSADRISTYALEAEIATYANIDDAVGFSYLQGGHAFYVLTFPAANKTWCFDVTTQQWAERAYLNVSGFFDRHRMIAHTAYNGQNVVLDWKNGNLYALDPNAYTDNGNPIPRVRSFPHISGSDGNRLLFRQFIADMEVGRGMPDSSAPQIFLRWSDTRGVSWGQPVANDLGAIGEFYTSIQWQRLGYARDRVFELSWTAPVRTALNGAWIDVTRART